MKHKFDTILNYSTVDQLEHSMEDIFKVPTINKIFVACKGVNQRQNLQFVHTCRERSIM